MTVGQITNHMSTDAYNMFFFCQQMHYLWAIPFRVSGGGSFHVYAPIKTMQLSPAKFLILVVKIQTIMSGGQFKALQFNEV